MPPTLRLLVIVLLACALPSQAQTLPRPSPAGAGSAPATGPAQPARNPAFYSAEVNLSSTSAGEKRSATMRALGQVVVRLTGNTQAPSNPVIRRAAGSLDALVVKSEVRQESDTVNGVPVYRSVLAVSFDPESVDALVAGAGLKYWTSARPKPILWLAIDDGRGPRLVTGKQTAVVKPLATRGLERGMRFLLPAGTAAELAAVPSIVALDAPSLQRLTGVYRNDAQLVGKVYRKAPGWAADWVFSRDGAELARWSFADADPRKVIASGVDDAANAIAKRDAVQLDTGVAGVHTVLVQGIRGQGDFVRVMAYLQNLAVVRRVSTLEASPQDLRLQLDLSVGMKGFRTLLGNSGILLAAPEDGAGGVTRFIVQ